MARLKSHISTDSDEFRANEAYNRELCETLQERLAEARQGGGGRTRARHAEQGKLLVRERIERLADPGSPFLETLDRSPPTTATTPPRRPPAWSPGWPRFRDGWSWWSRTTPP